MKTILTLLISLFALTALNAQCVVHFNQSVDGTTGTFAANYYLEGDTAANPAGTQYVWSIGDITLTGQTITYEFNSIGTFEVCLTATLGDCSATTCNDIIISDSPVEDSCSMFLTYDITHASSAEINDGAIDITVQGGTAPYSYYWSNEETTEDINDLYEGTYMVEVSDNEACALTYTFYVAAENDSTYNDTTVADYIYAGAYYEFASEEDCTADVWAEVYGGTPPYIYEWSNEETTNSFYGACNGDFYCVTVTDAEGLMAEACVAIEYYNYQDSTWVVIDSLETTVDTCLDIVYGEIIEYIIDGNVIIVTWEFIDSDEEVINITITYPVNDTITVGVYEIYLYVNCDDFKSMTTYSDWIQITEEDFTGIITPIEQQNYNIYPNPVNSILNLDIYAKDNDNAEIQIINTAGQIVYSSYQSFYSGQNNISFDVNSLNQGVYFLRINGENTYETKKFIK